MTAPIAKEKLSSICHKTRCANSADAASPAMKMMEVIS